MLPLFARRTQEVVGALLPELYLDGLAQGDLELAVRGLLGDGAPLSSSSIARLKAQWQLDYETWTHLVEATIRGAQGPTLDGWIDQLASVEPAPGSGGHPNSPTCGHLKIRHP